MTNNFQNIITLISRELNPGDFFFLQVIKRRKENPEMEKGDKLIDTFYIKDYLDLEKKKNRIIELCNQNNARAYIWLNKRNEKKIALQTLKLIAENIANEQYNIKNCYNSCCGQFHSDNEKKWIIDIDYIDYDKDYLFGEMYTEIQKLIYETGKDDSLYFNNTKNGFHIVCNPFNMSKLTYKLEIKKDHPTILYQP